MAVRSRSVSTSPLNAKNVSPPTRALGVLHRTGSAQRLLLVGDLDAHPATGRFLHGHLERLGQVRRQQDDLVDPVPLQEVEDVLDVSAVRDRQQVLRTRVRQGTEPRAEAARDQ